MSLLLILSLIVSCSLIEVLISQLNPNYGLLFALASFSLVKIDPALIFLSLSLIALHFLFLSLKSLYNLRFTREAQERKGFIKARQYAHELYIKKSIKSLS